MRSILESCLVKSEEITLHCPVYNCWTTFDMAIKGLHNITVLAYKSPLELKRNISASKNTDIVLLVDYFGVSDYSSYLEAVNDRCITIFDLAHSFVTQEYIKGLMGLYDYIFTSLRKMVPTPDGAIVFTYKNLQSDLQTQRKRKDPSIYWKTLTTISKYNKLDCFIDRIGFKYRMFQMHEDSLSLNSYSKASMDLFFESNLTDMLQKRIKNYNELYNSGLSEKYNTCSIFKLRQKDIYPLYFPIKSKNPIALQKILLMNKIYCPIFWPELEKDYQIIGLPIDDRYEVEHMQKIIKTLYSLDD